MQDLNEDSQKRIDQEYEQNQVIQDMKDAKKYYLKFIDVFQACNEGGFDTEEMKQACTEVIRKYADTMRPFFANNTELMDFILYG